jgi:hypothetical protein
MIGIAHILFGRAGSSLDDSVGAQRLTGESKALDDTVHLERLEPTFNELCGFPIVPTRRNRYLNFCVHRIATPKTSLIDPVPHRGLRHGPVFPGQLGCLMMGAINGMPGIPATGVILPMMAVPFNLYCNYYILVIFFAVYCFC